MTIAELFVNLGVKGEGSAARTMGNVQKGLGDISSAGLAAKAALLAVIYGAERLTGAAAGRGKDLTMFANLTSLSTKELQRWELAAQRAGGSAEEMQGALKSIQSVMTDMITGKGVPAGMGILARTVGFDISKARDAFYVMNKLKEFAKAVPADIGNAVMKSFGMSEGVIATFRSAKFRPDLVRASEILSDREIKNLDHINTQWVNFWNMLKMFSMRKVSIFGAPVIRELSEAINMVFKLERSFDSLAKKIPEVGTAAKGIAGIIAVTFAPISSLVVALIALLSDLNKFSKKQGMIYETLQKGQSYEHKETKHSENESFMKYIWTEYLGGMKDMFSMLVKGVAESLNAYDPKLLAPSVKGGTENKKAEQNVNITNNWGNQDIRDVQRLSDTSARSIRNAAAQLQGAYNNGTP